jgi:RNA polymerase sigma factor (sigma-70 family)
MAINVLNRVVHQLRRSSAQQASAALLDGDLLENYISRRDEAAFEALVRRHGPMVLGVCQRILRNHADAEDAFQATFLVLVRRAQSIRKKGAVANWLYGVAHHTALKARIMNRTRRSKELAARTICQSKHAEEGWQQVQALLDGELSLLRDKYRVPIVLCDLEGKTIKEAAAHLGWPQGTVATRLRRGRGLLAGRLARHGLALSAAGLAGAVSTGAGQAAVPAALLGATLRAAGTFGTGQALLAGGVSTKVAALTEGVLKAMLLSKLKSATAVVVVLAVFGAGLRVSHSALADGDDTRQAIQNPLTESSKPQKATASGAKRLLISSPVRGIITEVVKLGDKVRPGAVLARLDDRAAKADLDIARATLDFAKADRIAAEAQLVDATRRAEETKKLLAEKLIKQTAYDEAISVREKSAAELAQKKADVQAAEGGVEQVHLLLTKCVLRSPVAGTVCAVFKQPGARVKAGECLLEIEASQPAQASKPAQAHQPAQASKPNADTIDDYRLRVEQLESEVAAWKDRAAWSERMVKLGFMTNNQAQADRIRLENAKVALIKTREDALLNRPSPAAALGALAYRFRYRVPVEMGYTEFSQGGRLEILEVWGTRPKIEIGGQYLVRGTYAMPFHDDGTVCLYLTTLNWTDSTSEHDLQRAPVKKGKGEFTLLHTMNGPGSFHLCLVAWDRDRSVTIANVYFGTGDNVWRKRP